MAPLTDLLHRNNRSLRFEPGQVTLNPPRGAWEGFRVNSCKFPKDENSKSCFSESLFSLCGRFINLHNRFASSPYNDRGRGRFLSSVLFFGRSSVLWACPCARSFSLTELSRRFPPSPPPIYQEIFLLPRSSASDLLTLGVVSEPQNPPADRPFKGPPAIVGFRVLTRSAALPPEAFSW